MPRIGRPLSNTDCGARGLPVALAPLIGAGWLANGSRSSEFRLTARGFDRYHDLERWVTYQLIEPLWAELLAEHAAEGTPAQWVAPSRGRPGRLWHLASRAMERPVRRTNPTSSAHK